MTDTVLILNNDADWFAAQLRTSCPSFNYRPATTARQALDYAPDASILIGLAPQISDQLLAAMRRLKWIHALTTGVDNLLDSAYLTKTVTLSNSNGFHGPQMSELAILLMLSTLRNFPKIMENQKARIWERWPQPLLNGKTACVVGLGAVAEGLAPRLNALGMTLIGVSDGRADVPGFDEIYARKDLADAAGRADFLIVLVPYSPATHHIINDQILAAMAPGAILINLARGGCVDETALQARLQSGALRAAALDVFAQEPLPADNNLWTTPGLTITPHIGGFSDVYPQQVLPVVVENLTAWAAGGAAALPNPIAHGGM